MYKIKEGAELPKEFKIKVNPHQSEALQKYLFSLGYNWGFTAKEPKYLDSKYLYLYIGGKLMHGTFKETFQKDPLPKIKFKDYFEKLVKSIRPISMKCTQENWDDVKPILEKNGLQHYKFTAGYSWNDFDPINGLEYYAIDSFLDYSYITNKYHGVIGLISNILSDDKDLFGREVYEEWDKNVFLNACGITETVNQASECMSKAIEKETSFPEKWCIKVTEDNYHDLKDWMYKNSINYVGFEVGWFRNKHISIGQTFYSHGYLCWNEPRSGEVHQEITTEQFRNNNDVQINKAKYYKQKSDILRKEKFLMNHEIIRYKSEIADLKHRISHSIDKSSRIMAYKSEITTLNQRIQNYIADANFNAKKITDLETQINSLSESINLYKNIINRINNSLNSFDLP